jgi:indole-3-glycerol phosphate synthase
MSRLDDLVGSAREGVRRRQAEISLQSLADVIAARGGDRTFKEALVRPGLSLIAEFKRSSPSAGEIRPGASVAEIVSAYERGGAAALSILTEGSGFGGSLADLREARASSNLPILRKDFIVDEYQLYEAAAGGADAILLIVAALEDEDLLRLHAEATALELDCLVEVHDEEELERALAADADVIGINNRDLRDFRVNTERTAELLVDVPAGKTVVSESGWRTREELDELDRIGVDAVLMGEALMRAADPEEATREMVGSELTRENDVP